MRSARATGTPNNKCTTDARRVEPPARHGKAGSHIDVRDLHGGRIARVSLDNVERARILIADDEGGLRLYLRTLLERQGYLAVDVPAGDRALERIRAQPFDLLLTDIRMPGLDGLQLCREALSLDPELLVIVMSAFGSLETAREALDQGATDYLSKPCDQEAVLLAVEKALRQRRLDTPNAADSELPTGTSKATHALRQQLMAVSAPACLWLHGESGSGKHHAAYGLEAQLGLKHRRDWHASDWTKGPFEAACLHLMPRVETLTVTQQQALAQQLETLPETSVFVALSRDSSAALDASLHYRLAPGRLRLTPLRERPEDIIPLAHVWLAQRAQLTAQARERLLAYPWPGNVHELFAVLETALRNAAGSRIGLEHLPPTIVPAVRRTHAAGEAGSLSIKSAVSQVEVALIRQALERTGGNKSAAARLLELSPRALHYKIRDYGLEFPATRTPEADAPLGSEDPLRPPEA